MQLFSLACVAAYCVVALVVGIRLLGLARRTRELPELMIGIALLSGGMVGYPAKIAARLLASGSPEVALSFAAAGSMGIAISAAGIMVAWWKIYHAASRWAPRVVCVWTALLVAFLALELRGLVAGLDPGAGSWDPARQVVQGGCYAAIAWSGFRHHALLRRRLRIGLADPMLVNRILLWNVAASCATLQFAYGMAIPFLNSFFDASGAEPAFVATLGLVIVLSLAYAFYPRQSHLRGVKGRAGQEVG